MYVYLLSFQNDRETLQRIQMGDIDFDFELWQNISRYPMILMSYVCHWSPLRGLYRGRVGQRE